MTTSEMTRSIGLWLLGDPLQRLAPVPGLEHRVTLLPQPPAGERPDHVLVLHHQNRLDAAAQLGRRAGGRYRERAGLPARGR